MSYVRNGVGDELVVFAEEHRYFWSVTKLQKLSKMFSVQLRSLKNSLANFRSVTKLKKLSQMVSARHKV